MPNQALRWQPTWEQITPSARDGLTPPDAAAAAPANDEGRRRTKTPSRRSTSESPTVWVVAEDGLVRPVPVKTGLTDGMVTEITGGELEPGDAVVVNVVREAKPDFVSSFVTK